MTNKIKLQREKLTRLTQAVNTEKGLLEKNEKNRKKTEEEFVKRQKDFTLTELSLNQKEKEIGDAVLKLKKINNDISIKDNFLQKLKSKEKALNFEMNEKIIDFNKKDNDRKIEQKRDILSSEKEIRVSESILQKLKAEKEVYSDKSVELQDKIKTQEKNSLIIKKQEKVIEENDKSISESVLFAKETNNARDDLEEIDKNIKEKRNILQEIIADIEKIERTKEEKTFGLNKREEEVKEKEQGMKFKEIEMNENEKRIRQLGNTLQKHYDKQQIPIKVFK